MMRCFPALVAAVPCSWPVERTALDPLAAPSPADAAAIPMLDAADPVAGPAPTTIDAAPAPAAGTGTEVSIVDWAITWTDERSALMLEYRRVHVDPAATDLTIEPRAIVLHYT